MGTGFVHTLIWTYFMLRTGSAALQLFMLCLVTSRGSVAII